MPKGSFSVTFKESEKELYRLFKEKYSSPSARIKDMMREDLENKKNSTAKKTVPMIKI